MPGRAAAGERDDPVAPRQGIPATGPDNRSNSEASATDAADAAVKTQRQLERVYREAASALLEVQDLREVMGRRELSRRISRISETLTEAADRVWYATVKEV